MYLSLASLLYFHLLYGIFGGHAAIVLFVISGAVYRFFKNPSPEQDVFDGFEIIAHRGCGHDAPENTMAAFRKADQNGADGIELDVDFTQDGVAVVIHDDTVNRTTDGTGAVGQLSFQELIKLNAAAKYRKSKSYSFEKIPTLEEVVKYCLDSEIKMYLDVKGSASLAIPALEELFLKYPAMEKYAVVCSFQPLVPYQMRRRLPHVKVGLTHRSWYFSRHMDGKPRYKSQLLSNIILPPVDIMFEWAVYSFLPDFIGISAFLICNQDVNQRVVNEFTENGIQVIVWTVNTQVEKDYVTKALQCSYMTDSLEDDDFDVSPVDSNNDIVGKTVSTKSW